MKFDVFNLNNISMFAAAIIKNKKYTFYYFRIWGAERSKYRISNFLPDIVIQIIVVKGTINKAKYNREQQNLYGVSSHFYLPI